MKKIIFILIPVLLVGTFFLFLKKPSKSPQQVSLPEIRIGWQTPWATQGQLTQVLKNTPILADAGLKGNFIGFESGAPLNEAALAGGVDVLFTADQPAATLLSKNPEWVIIGRLMYNRVSLYVPPNSPIKTVSDLKNKTVGMPFGAAAQRMALKVQKDAGLNPEKDVKNINIGIYEQSDLVKDAQATKWGEIDALAGFDPSPAIFEEKGLVRNLEVGKVVSVIVMSKEYIKKNPKAPVQFLKAFRQAYGYYRGHIEEANAWFTAESKLTISAKALETASSMEPNVQATKDEDIRIGFIPEDYQIMQDAADFIFDRGLVKQKVVMKDHIDLSFLTEAKLQ